MDSTFEEMKTAHNQLVEGVQKDLDFAEKRARRHRTDINNAYERIGSLEDQVVSLVQDVRKVRQQMDTAYDVVRRQSRALNTMEGRLCHCGSDRWAKSLEDLRRTPALSEGGSSLSYVTPPQVPGSTLAIEAAPPPSPDPLPIRDPSVLNPSDQENVEVSSDPPIVSPEVSGGVRRFPRSSRRAEPYPARKSLGTKFQQGDRDRFLRRRAERGGGGDTGDSWSPSLEVGHQVRSSKDVDQQGNDHLSARRSSRSPLCFVVGCGCASQPAHLGSAP